MIRPALLFVLLGIATLALFGVSLFFGSIHIPAHEVVAALCGGESGSIYSNIVLEMRLPQAVTALLSGAALAAAGLIMQTVFQNPLADPSILGVNSGASLGVAIVMLALGGSVVTMGTTFSGFVLVVIAAFAGAFVIIGLLLLFSHLIRNNLTLLIVGIMISFVSSSLISLLNYSATEQGVHSYIMWGLGNFGGVNLKTLPLYAAAMGISIALALILVKPLNAMLLGNNYAQNLGINIKAARTWLIVVTGFISAVITAFCGPISFIGLAVPHMARMMSRSVNHRTLLPLTLLTGAVLGLLCNWLCSLPADGTLIPLNVITPLFGVPVILYVLLRRR